MTRADWESFDEAVRLDPVQRRCAVAVMLDTRVPISALDKVTEILDDASVSHATLRRALVARLGRSDAPSVYSLRWHRIKACNCWKAESDDA